MFILFLSFFDIFHLVLLKHKLIYSLQSALKGVNIHHVLKVTQINSFFLNPPEAKPAVWWKSEDLKASEGSGCDRHGRRGKRDL